MNNVTVENKDDSNQQVIEKVESIDAHMQTFQELAESAIENYTKAARIQSIMERKSRREEMNAVTERHAKELDVENQKHKRLTYFFYFTGASIVSLCMVAFLTNNAEHVKTILMAVGFLLGGQGVSKMMSKS